jgi:hypothetical protein
MPTSGRDRQLSQWLCVPVFVREAVRSLVGVDISLEHIADALEARLSPEDPNPRGLSVAVDPTERGVSIAAAERLLSPFLLKISRNLRFRHVPFNTIVFRLYDVVLSEVLDKGGVPGVGYNYALLGGQPGTLRHVSRIVGFDGERTVTLLDSTQADQQERSVSWQALEAAVLDVASGYWVIGTQEAMQLTHTLGWSEGTSGR